MTEMTPKTEALGFLFVRKNKSDPSKKFLSGYIKTETGEKVQIIAHKAKKLTDKGDEFFYIFKNDESATEATTDTKKVTLKGKGKDTNVPF